MQKRVLGKTGRELSLVGVGGVTVQGMTQTEADKLIGGAIDKGVNYFDVAPSYGKDQETELRFGGALEHRRNDIFLACKTGQRTKEGAAFELHRSLKNLRTDHFDLYQLHAITTREDVDTAFGSGGAMEALLKAQADGKVKHIGFSAHSVEAALLALDYYDFASALFPINFVTFSQGNFGPQIFAKCEEKGTARLALKAMAKTLWKQDSHSEFPHCWYEPISDPYWAELALRFTLSQPITSAVPPGDPTLNRMAIEFAGRFTPITAEETSELMLFAEGVEPIFRAA